MMTEVHECTHSSSPEIFTLSTLRTIYLLYNSSYVGLFAIFFAFEFCITLPVQYQHVHDVILLSNEIIKKKKKRIQLVFLDFEMLIN